MRRIVQFIAITSLTLSTGILGAGASSAAQSHHQSPSTCSGTLAKPGVLAGRYLRDVIVTGVCVVDGGAAVVKGDLILAPNSTLNATFALNDVAGTGTSSLIVHGDVRVESGAVLGLGCEPNFNPCTDDPKAATGGTLTGHDHVFGDVTASQPLAVLLHASTIGQDVSVQGGGGGLTCAVPRTGVFHVLKSPVFTDAEDNTIGGDLTFTGIETCWLGALRNTVRGDVADTNNTMADPDADEILANVIHGDIACSGNSPAVQYGDSHSSPNQVLVHASGECAFNVRQPNPSPKGHKTPISVKM